MDILRFLRLLKLGGAGGSKRNSDTIGQGKPAEQFVPHEGDVLFNQIEDDLYDDTSLKVVSRNRKAPSKQIRWIESGEVVNVAGRNIPGMIYLGATSSRSGPAWEGNPFLDPKLRVSKGNPDIGGESMPYWPSYASISPQARAAYLDWLANGRRDKRYGVGYVFLFFYGIERRFFQDSSTAEEKRSLVAEVEGLLRTYGENRSVRGYLGKFLDTAKIVLGSDIEGALCSESAGYEIPLALRVAIGRKVEQGVPISADWLLAWYTAHPNYTFRMPARRANREFKALFNLLFDERHPKGLKVRVPKRFLSASYSASSGAFDVDLDTFIGDVPDISRLSQPLNAAGKVVDEATDALDKYSRFLGRNPAGRETMEAHALLPKRLRSLFPCPEMEELRVWAEGIIESGELPLVEEIIERLDGTQPEKVSKRPLTRASDALAALSLGMAPDPRFALRMPRIGDPIVIFRLSGEVGDTEQVSEKYKEILITLALGSFVAGADGSVANMELDALRSLVASAEITDRERERLHANLKWMATVPPDLAMFRRQFRNVPERSLNEFGRVALAMAAVDDTIGPQEIKAVEKLYGALGLSTDGVYAALHELTSMSEPVVVRTADDRDTDFKIPAKPASDEPVILDADRIAHIRADTVRVSGILGTIFQEEDADAELVDEFASADTHFFRGLDSRHTEFVNELLTRPHWEETEFQALVKRFNLMPGGALEAVNEWSFEQFDDVLIEEYEGYELNPLVATELRS